MRILSLTAGASTMYCGSCLRDNALATELMARGHDVTLVPLYTPTVSDEPNVSRKRVFFGGVSVYLQQHLSLFRHTPRWFDRLWDSPRFIRLVSKRSIQTDGKFLGDMTVSMLKGEHGHQRKELDKLLGWLGGQPKPDVVILPFVLLIGLAKPIREALGCKVLCTLQGDDLFLEQLQEPWKAEALSLIRERIADVDGFIAVSDYYASFMATYLGILSEQIRTVPIGINLKDFDYLTPYVPGRTRKHRVRSGPGPHDPSPSPTSGASPRRRGSIGSSRHTAFSDSSAACSRRGWKPLGGSAERARRISPVSRSGCMRLAFIPSSAIAASSAARTRSGSSVGPTSFPCQRRITNRRASPSSRRWLLECRSSSRRTAPSRRW